MRFWRTVTVVLFMVKACTVGKSVNLHNIKQEAHGPNGSPENIHKKLCQQLLHGLSYSYRTCYVACRVHHFSNVLFYLTIILFTKIAKNRQICKKNEIWGQQLVYGL